MSSQCVVLPADRRSGPEVTQAVRRGSGGFDVDCDVDAHVRAVAGRRVDTASGRGARTPRPRAAGTTEPAADRTAAGSPRVTEE